MATSAPAVEAEPEFDIRSLVGRVVGGRYRLEEVLGQGAMGAVYHGVQLALSKPYAIKVLLPSLTRDPQFVARFQQEARIAAAIRHPGLVEVFDYGVEDGIAFYVMELLRGQTVADYVKPHRRLSAEEAVHIVADAADAVATAHEAGVIHRDLKPANIFLADDGVGTVVKVLDFGVSKATVFNAAAGSPMTMSGSICGTPAYMSPEQVGRGTIDGRCDVYALGVVLYRLLTGSVPFDASEAVVVMCMHLERPVPPLDQYAGLEVPKAVEEVLFRSLAKKPEGRYDSMRDFARALRKSIAGRPVTSTASATEAARPTPETVVGPIPEALKPEALKPVPKPSGTAGRRPSKGQSRPPVGERTAAKGTPPPRNRRRPLVIAGAGVAAAVVGAGIGFLVIRGFSPSQPESPAVVARPQRLQQPTPVADEAVEAPLPGSINRRPPTVEQTPATPKPVDDAPLPETPDEEVGGGHEATAAVPPPMVLPPPTQERQRPVEEARPRPQEETRPRPAEDLRPRLKGEIALTSKVPGKVMAEVGGAKLELYANVVTLVSVPAGSNRVKFTSPSDGASCTVIVPVLANLRRALVFGPEANMVVLRAPSSGALKLDCQSP